MGLPTRVKGWPKERGGGYRVTLVFTFQYKKAARTFARAVDLYQVFHAKYGRLGMVQLAEDIIEQADEFEDELTLKRDRK